MWSPPAPTAPAWETGQPRRRWPLLLASVATALVLAAAAAWALLPLGAGPAHATSSHTPAAQRTTPPATSPTATAPAPTTSSTAATPSTAAVAAPAATRVVTFSPWTLDGTPGPGITITAHDSGHCWEQAMGSPRDDAWRCSDNHTDLILDPCLASQNNAPHAGELLCPDNGSLTRMVWLVPDAPLPDKPAQEPSTQPLFLALADGQTCFAAGGAGSILSTVNGQNLNYTCPRGDLYGAPDTSQPAWTITYRPTGSSESSTIPIAKAYL